MDRVNKYVSTEEPSTKVINESVGDDRYEMKCSIDFNYPSDLKYKGQEIEDIGYGLEYTLSFRIDQEHRSWGIKTMSVYDVQGPEELEVEVVFYPEGSEDPKEEYITFKVDWDSINYEGEDPKGMIGIDEDVQIELANDSEGNIIVNGITVITYSF